MKTYKRPNEWELPQNRGYDFFCLGCKRKYPRSRTNKIPTPALCEHCQKAVAMYGEQTRANANKQ